MSRPFSPFNVYQRRLSPHNGMRQLLDYSHVMQDIKKGLSEHKCHDHLLSLPDPMARLWIGDSAEKPKGYYRTRQTRLS